MKRGSYHGYSTLDKYQLVLECKDSPLEKVAAKYKIPPSTLRNWRKTVQEGKELPKGAKRRCGAGRKPILSENEEEELVDWVQEWRNRGAPIDTQILRTKALELTPDKTYGKEAKPFKATSGWSKRFLDRHDLVARVPTRQRSTTSCVDFQKEAIGRLSIKFDHQQKKT